MFINPTFLNTDFAQPKLQIAQMVAGEGELTPRVFDDFHVARAYGPSILRSEGPWEHALTLKSRRVGGVSGLLDSHPITEGKITEALSREWPIDNFYDRNHLKHALNRFLTGGGEREFFDDLIRCTNPDLVEAFCKLTGTPCEEFFRQTTFTYWQLLGGHNCTVIADDVISGRYHVMITGAGSVGGYCLVDAGERKIVRQAATSEHFDWQDLFNTYPLTSWYERLRHLSFFDPNHCPIVECQLVEGAIYFLQYHLGRDFVGRGFKLTRDLRDGEFEAAFVRGTTTADGLDIDVVMYLPQSIERFSPRETGSLGWGMGPDNCVYQELAWRFMLAGLDQNSHVAEDPSRIRFDLLKLGVGHTPRSQIFKPQLGLIGDFLQGVTEDDIKKIYRDSKTGALSLLRFHVTSDGERALVQYLGNFISSPPEFENQTTVF